jgi:hypothetical protein
MRHIAQDYLAIQGCATPSECAFSSGGITGSACHSSLLMEIFKALQILKSAYCNGYVMAAQQASKHIDALIMEYDGGSDWSDKWPLLIEVPVVCWEYEKLWYTWN